LPFRQTFITEQGGCRFHMSWRPGAKVAVGAALAMLFLAAALPLAAADHAYSHRYVVFGRVVDAAGNSVPGLTVDLGYEPPFEPEGPCATQPNIDTEAFGPTRTQPVTNEMGEFIFCFHTHAMSRTTPGAGIIRIDSLDLDQRFEFDGFMRYSIVTVKLPDVHPAANTTANDATYTVVGRAWQAAGTDIRIEGIRVYGDTIQNTPVEVTLAYNGQEPVTVTTRTNGYGDFAVRVPVVERATSGTVTVTIENSTFTSAVTDSGMSAVRAEVAKANDPFVAKALLGVGIAAAVVVGGGAVWYTTNKVRAAREERINRERSERRRANKK